MLHVHPRAAVAIPLPRRLAKKTRTAMEVAIEQHLTAVDGLVSLLNVFDGEADLEPSLGGIAHHGFFSCTQENWADGRTDDLEGDAHDGREPGEDHEPSLAHTLSLDQTKAAKQPSGWAVEDGEAEHDDREPDADFERDAGDDREEVSEDEGSVERSDE